MSHSIVEVRPNKLARDNVCCSHYLRSETSVEKFELMFRSIVNSMEHALIRIRNSSPTTWLIFLRTDSLIPTGIGSKRIDFRADQAIGHPLECENEVRSILATNLYLFRVIRPSERTPAGENAGSPHVQLVLREYGHVKGKFRLLALWSDFFLLTNDFGLAQHLSVSLLLSHV
jgi:hypothetical protein